MKHSLDSNPEADRDPQHDARMTQKRRIVKWLRPDKAGLELEERAFLEKIRSKRKPARWSSCRECGQHPAIGGHLRKAESRDELTLCAACVRDAANRRGAAAMRTQPRAASRRFERLARIAARRSARREVA